MQWGVRPLMVSLVEFAATAVGQQRAASCSPMATMARQILAAAVRFWFRATSSLARAPREAVVPAVVQQAAVDPQRVACRLLAAAVVRLLLVAAVRLWFLEGLFSAPALDAPAVWAQGTADRRRTACGLLAAAVVRQRLAMADRLWFQEASSSALVLEEPAVSAKEQAMADRRWAACRLPMASQWAASDRETACLADLYSESESLLERPTAEAKVRAKRRRQRLQRRHLQ